MLLKKLAALAVATSLAFSFAACSGEKESAGSSTAASVSVETDDEGNALLEKAKAANEKIESYVSKNTLDFAFNNSDGDGSASVTTTITDKQTIPVEKSFVTDTIGNGESLVSSQVYVREENGKKMLYIGQDSEWYKSEVADEMLYYMVGHYDMKAVGKVFLDAVDGLKFEGEEEINGVKASKTTGVISAEKIADTMLNAGVFVTVGMATLTEEHMEGSPAMAINFWIDSETGDLLKIAFDAAPIYQVISDNVFELVKDMEGYENAKALEINKYDCVYEISDINSVNSVDFPSELESAVDIAELSEETATEGEAETAE